MNFDKLLRVKFSANMQAVNSWDRKQPRRDWQPADARAVDVILRLIRAEGRVVRREARTRSRCQFNGVESEDV